MNQRPSSFVVRNHAPAEPCREAEDAGLNGCFAFVLSTFDPTSTDMTLDHESWSRCMQALGASVQADRCEIYERPIRRFLGLFGPKRGAPLGSLERYTRALRADSEAPLWDLALWWKGDRVVSAARCEPWFRVGGPDVYHDTYTTCVFAARDEVEHLAVAVEQALR